MLAASIHEHAGLGNQIWRAIVCRTFADRLGYDYGISHPGWRGSFLNFDWGKNVNLNVEVSSDFKQTDQFQFYYEEKMEPFPEVCGEVGNPDPELYRLKDNTYINGNFQRMSYIEDYRNKICSWLSYDDKFKVHDYSSDNVCVIQLRGGDYTTGHSMLPSEYYHSAMKYMLDNNPSIEFVIVTDDPKTASLMIPGVPIVGSAVMEEVDEKQGHIGWYKYSGGPVSVDYSILNTAKYAIISASTFAFWPIWTNNTLNNVIAPAYWFDWSRSTGWWRPKDSIVNDDRWLWLDRFNDLYSSKAFLT